MTVEERHERIVGVLAEKKFLDLAEATRVTQSSVATVRRDFATLAKRGVLRRVRGGVRLLQADAMLPFAFREVQFSQEKDRVAQRAAALLRHGDVIFVDGGTTTFHLASHLPDISLRLITNSMRLAAALEPRCRRGALEVYVTGGFLYPQAGLLVGPAAAASVAQYHADWAFLSVGGLTSSGLSNTNELVVETERKMIACADKVVVLADHSKLDRHAMCHVCGLPEIDLLVTEECPALVKLRPHLQRHRVRESS